MIPYQASPNAPMRLQQQCIALPLSVPSNALHPLMHSCWTSWMLHVQIAQKLGVPAEMTHSCCSLCAQMINFGGVWSTLRTLNPRPLMVHP